MKTILFIAGARPNFIKISPVMKSLEKYEELEFGWIHTGQHYNDELSEIFVNVLKMPRPIANLNIGSGERKEQIGKIVKKLGAYLKVLKPDLVVAAGDVNSTLGAALSAMENNSALAHIESGLRSFNWKMPEELNRVTVDHLSDLLFLTEETAIENLKNEGISLGKMHFVGNSMIDSLVFFKEKADKSLVLKKFGLEEKKFALLTMHRSENVDAKDVFGEIFEAICEINKSIPVVCPLHPRTMEASRKFGIDWEAPGAPLVIPPQGYLDFLKLEKSAKFIMTDSGGVQEEASVLGTACLTLRTETERPATVKYGTNEIAGIKKQNIIEAAKKAMETWKTGTAVPFWDGCAGDRIASVIRKYLSV